MKVDVTVVEGVPPDQALSDFMRELLLSGEATTLENIQEMAIGSHPGVSAVTARSDNASDRHTTIAFRMAPDKVLMVVVLPEGAGGSMDFLGILGSIALSPEEGVALPEYPPAPALIDVPEGCIR